MNEKRQLIQQWMSQNPGLVEGLRRAIGGAEGATYNTLFGGGTFKDYSRHPDQVVRSGGYASAAAGRYQFLPGTYASVQRELGLPDFSPRSQDEAMVAKVRERLMPAGGLAALSQAGTLTPKLQSLLAPEWASFPTEKGTSYYGQPVKKASQIQQWFDQASKSVVPSAQVAANAPAPTGQSKQQNAKTFLDLFKDQVMSELLTPKPTSGLMGVSGLMGLLGQ